MKIGWYGIGMHTGRNHVGEVMIYRIIYPPNDWEAGTKKPITSQHYSQSI